MRREKGEHALRRSCRLLMHLLGHAVYSWTSTVAGTSEGQGGDSANPVYLPTAHPLHLRAPPLPLSLR